MNRMLYALRRCLDLSGRAGLAEFWAIYFLLMLVDVALGAVIGTQRVPLPFPPGYSVLLLGSGGTTAAALLTLAINAPLFAAATRRLHDQDRSGWLQLVLLIPYIGILAMIGLMCAPGTRGPNRFGPDPRPQPASGLAS